MSNDIEVKIESNIFKYLSENLNKAIEEIKSLYSIIIKKTAAGVNNKNYIVQIYNKKNNSLFNTLFYKHFQGTCSLADRNLEADIVKYLGEKNIGPKLLKYDKEEKSYRIDEFVNNGRNVLIEEHLQYDIINKVFKILSQYLLFDDFYKYKIDNTNIVIESINNSKVVNDKINFISIILSYSEQSKIAYNKFCDDVNEYYKNNPETSIMSIEGTDIKQDMNEIKDYINNFKEIFINLIKNKNYFLCMNHNDVHRLNLLIDNNKKLYLIDNENIMLNFIGFDAVLYLCLCVFNVLPCYAFNEHLLDLDKFYNYYLEYYDMIKGKLEKYENKYDFKYLKTKEYFFFLVKIISIYGIIFCSANVNFQKEYLDKSCYNYSRHVHDRYKIYNMDNK